MSDSMERIDLTNPKAIAIEIAAAGLIAWKLKNMYDRRHDDADAAEPHGYPMTEYTDDTIIYVNTLGSGPLAVEAIDQEGLIKVTASGRVNAEGQPEVALEKVVPEVDPRRLAILMDHILAIKSFWQEKVAQALPDSLQSD